MKDIYTFIGADHESVILRIEKHPLDCECEDCELERWQQAELSEMFRGERRRNREQEEEHHAEH